MGIVVIEPGLVATRHAQVLEEGKRTNEVGKLWILEEDATHIERLEGG